MLTFVAACLIPAFVISCLVTAVVRRCAPGWGLIDRPAARKVHLTPTPLGGGIGIYFGFVVPVVAAFLLAHWWLATDRVPDWMPVELSNLLPGVLDRAGLIWMLIGAGTLLSAAGLLDDLHPVPWQPRLMIQFAVAAGLVAGGVRGSLFVSYPWVGALLTIFWIVGLINSLNFLDNMDMLSGGVALIAAALFAVIMLTLTGEPRWLVGGALLVLAGSLAGFLVHNRPPARIFMGDTGSTLIGMLLASLTVLGTFYDESLPSRHVILAPLCVLAVPLYDTATVLWIRIREGRSPFQPDKCHFSHRLTEMGLSRPGAVRTVHLCTLTTGLGALLLYRVPGWTGAAVIVTLVLCVLSIIAVLETAVRRKSGTHDVLPGPPSVAQSSSCDTGPSQPPSASPASDAERLP
ncbi:MAG: undecaprenyl/decaprenyl-phosphate alpha-N-acetylglucosaminyl 1-phosphate transferase [Planctomycetaceae bacterium]|nr:undecaprenyl/decaprenyl-phosphate alpha-N-acetylglucosaminyl 1-phosphate transferase [Planctomycetaceae bacterium]